MCDNCRKFVETTTEQSRDLLVEVVLRPDLATDLLRRAAEIIRSELEGTALDSDGQQWLNDFKALTEDA